MKVDKKGGSWKTKIIGTMIVATIPISAYAVIDSYGYFTQWAAIGSSGISGSGPALSVGTGNSGWGRVNIFSAGSYLVNYDDDSAVIGEWNADTGGDEAFIVGNGTGSGDKKNALEVYKNGDVIIPKAQGDISMGAFGN